MNSVTTFMSEDHDRLDAIFSNFLEESDSQKQKELFLRLDSGLREHIRWEEEYLFSPFEERTGMKNIGPAAVMRIEHRQIKEFLQLIEERIGYANLDEAIKGFLNVLRPHNQKEEDILYPMLDQLLSEEEKKVFLGRVKASL